MGEYEDRYPDAYGQGENTGPDGNRRHFLGLGLTRQVRDEPGTVAMPRPEYPPVEPVRQPVERVRQPVERVRQAYAPRSARQICDDVYERLNDSPFIDATEVTVAVNGAEVTLDGTINSLIAVSLARALAMNTPGVAEVQVRLKVRPAARVYEMAPGPLAER